MSTAPGKVTLSKDKIITDEVRNFLRNNGYKLSKYNIDMLYYYVINVGLNDFLEDPEDFLERYQRIGDIETKSRRKYPRKL